MDGLDLNTPGANPPVTHLNSTTAPQDPPEPVSGNVSTVSPEGNDASNGYRRPFTRPNDTSKGVTVVYKPHELLADLVWSRDDGLRFAIKTPGNAVTYESKVDGKPPLNWFGDVANGGTVLLPSQASPYKSTGELLGGICKTIHEYFDCSREFLLVAGVYVLTTWVFERFYSFPYLRFLGDKDSGKTRATDVIGALCYRGLKISGASSSAVLYRMLEANGGTLAIDEADYEKNQSEVTKILNGGYSRNNLIWKNAPGPTDWVPKGFDAYGPKILNGREPFQDDSTESRCLTYRPVPTTRTNIKLQLPDKFLSETEALRNRCLSWRFEWFDKLEPRDVRIDSLLTRTNQILLPLLNVVSLVEDPTIAGSFRQALVTYGEALDADSKEIAKERDDVMLLDAYVSWNGVDNPTCGDLGRIAGSHPGNDRFISPRRVGPIMRTLGFRTKRDGSGIRVLPMAPAQLKALCKKKGVEGPK